MNRKMIWKRKVTFMHRSTLFPPSYRSCKTVSDYAAPSLELAQSEGGRERPTSHELARPSSKLNRALGRLGVARRLQDDVHPVDASSTPHGNPACTLLPMQRAACMLRIAVRPSRAASFAAHQSHANMTSPPVRNQDVEYAVRCCRA
jgi:hypothetical protein